MIARILTAAVLVPSLLALPSPSLGTPAPVAPSGRSASGAEPAVWNIDPVHSGVGFTIRHFVSRVRGKFRDFHGTVTADPEHWEDAVIDVAITTSSISTDNDRRDAHLRSNDFFAADSFPAILFRSTRIERSGDAAKIHGTLTIRGVTRPVVLDGQFTGLLKAAQGDRVGFEASTTVNRLDYGVKWNRAAEGGGAMLGDEVKIEISVEAVRARS